MDKYIGMPYDLHNRTGVNCWALVALVYKDLLGTQLNDYKAQSHQDIVATFTAAFAGDDHGFKLVDEPSEFCVVVMKNRLLQHCGIWYKGKVLHAHRQAGGVVYQPLKQASYGFKHVEYWKHD